MPRDVLSEVFFPKRDLADCGRDDQTVVFAEPGPAGLEHCGVDCVARDERGFAELFRVVKTRDFAES